MTFDKVEEWQKVLEKMGKPPSTLSQVASINESQPAMMPIENSHQKWERYDGAPRPTLLPFMPSGFFIPSPANRFFSRQRQPPLRWPQLPAKCPHFSPGWVRNSLPRANHDAGGGVGGGGAGDFYLWKSNFYPCQTERLVKNGCLGDRLEDRRLLSTTKRQCLSSKLQMKAIAYARVSTIGQSEEGVSLEMQKARIAAWCIGNGHELEAVFVETGSGGRADNRPELQKAMALVCKRRGILVVYSLSRFSRSVKDTLALTEQLDAANAHLASLSESLDTSSAVGRMVFKMLSTLAEFERDVLSERTRNALGHMRKMNRRISFKVPFGHTLAADKATLLPDANEQAAIIRMQERRAGGMTLAAICQTMETEGVRTRFGGKWFPKTIAAIIQRQHKLAA